MDRIASFKVNHLDLLPGLYVSRRDINNQCIITTFDMRITAPNREPVIDMPALHTIEHMGATYLRNSDRKDEIVYFGPMGCRTGCYIVIFGDLNSDGNFSEQNLSMAKYYIAKYRDSLIKERRFVYPE